MKRFTGLMNIVVVSVCGLMFCAFGTDFAGSNLSRLVALQQLDAAEDEAIEAIAAEAVEYESAAAGTPADAAAVAEDQKLGQPATQDSEDAVSAGAGVFPGGAYRGLRGGLLGRGASQRQTAANNSNSVRSQGIVIRWSEDRDVLYGFSVATGQWSVLRITPPESIVPTVGNDLGVVPLGKKYAAYSGTAGRWDVLEPNGDISEGPTLHHQYIIMRTSDHVYTFAEGLGQWTSPTDSTLQSRNARSQRRRVLGRVRSSRGSAELPLSTPPTMPVPPVAPSAPPAAATDSIAWASSYAPLTDLEKARSRAEAESLRIAQQLRDLQLKMGDKHPQVLTLRQQLEDAVTRAFTIRRKIQTQRMQAMESLLTSIRRSLEARQELQDRIISRRIEELLDPQIEWQTLRDATPGGEPTWGRPTVGAPSIPSGGPAGLSSSTIRSAKPAGRESGTVVSVAGTPSSFDWDRSERLLTRLQSLAEPVQEAQAGAQSLITLAERLQNPWRDTSVEERFRIAGVLDQSRMGGRGGGRRRAGSFGGNFGGGLQFGGIGRRDDDDDDRSSEEDRLRLDELAGNEAEYEKLRHARLKVLEDQLERQLDRMDKAIPALSGIWERYRGEIEDQTLTIREAELTLEAAEKIYETVRVESAIGDVDPIAVVNARVEVDKAQIHVERAATDRGRLKKIGDDNPQFDPAQYLAFVKANRALLEQLREPTEYDTR